MNPSSCRRSIHVVHICAIDWFVEVMLKQQIIALKKEGFDICVMCTPGPYREGLKQIGIEIIPVDIRRSMTPLRDLKSLWQLYRNIRKNKFDIVHTHTPKLSLLGQLAAKIAGVPVIINTVHGFYFHDNMQPLKRKFYILMEKIAAKVSTRIMSQSEEDIATAINLKICTPNKIIRLGNGIDLNHFSQDRYPDNFGLNKRRELGIPLDAFVVGIVGRKVREKGYIELFQAVSLLAKNNHNIWLLAIGPEEPEKEDAVSMSDAKTYGIDNRTIFFGHRRDIADLMMTMDIFVLPSYREGYPRSAMEASAMSLPVVTTNIRGCREVVIDGETGLLVPVRNTKSLAQAIDKLVNNKSLRLDMGARGRQRAESTFDEENVFKIIRQQYKQLLDDFNDV